MKHILVCILCLYTLMGRSQSIDTIYHQYYTHSEEVTNFANRIVLLPDSNILVITYRNAYYIINRKGEKQCEGSMYYPAYMFTTNVDAGYVRDGIQSFYVNIILDGCDYFEGFQHVTINDLCQETGVGTNPLKDLGINARYPRQDYEFPPLPGLPTYFVVEKDRAIVLDYQDSIRRIILHQPFRHHCINRQGNFVVATVDSLFAYTFQNGKPYLVTSRRHGYGVNDQYQIFFSSDSTFVIQTHKVLHLYNKSLEELKQIPTLASYDILLRWHDPYLLLFNEKYGEERLLRVFDSRLNVIFETTEDLHISRIWGDMAWLGDSTLLVANGEPGLGNSFPALKTHDFHATSNQINYDVGISDVHFDGYSKYESNPCFGETTTTTLLTNVRIAITNAGKVPVQQVKIIPQKAICDMYCGNNELYHLVLTEMNLIPGETRSFEIGNVEIERSIYSDTSLCLQVIIPDNHVDVNRENNKFCIGQTVKTGEPVEETTLYFSPNPATDKIYHSISSAENYVLQICNPNGQVLLTEVGKGNTRQQTDVSALTQGIYFCRFITETGKASIQRLIKI